jgi:hypothetical protein
MRVTFCDSLRRSLLIGLPVLFTLAGCGHTVKDYKEYHRVTSSGAFSARDKPADETTLTDSELSQNGYANIGAIDISSVQPLNIDDVRREAAGKGADLIKADISSQEGHESTKSCMDMLSSTNEMTAGAGSNLPECQNYSVETKAVNLSVVKGSLWRRQ